MSRSKKVQNLSDEALNDLLEKGDALPLEEETTYSAEQVDELFHYLHALILTDQPERATQVFDALKPAIDAQIADPAQQEQGLENLMEWALEAIRLVPESRSTFVCMPIYHELFEAFGDAQGRHAIQLTRARLQLLRHIDFWVSKGGVVGDLDEADQELIGEIGEGIQAELDAKLEVCKSNGWIKEAIQLHRGMATLRLSQSEPNEAIAHLKQVAELIPSLRDAQPTDLGDQYIDIGRLFFGFKKYATALKYFTQAHEQFTALGEDYEVFAMQAETLMEDCQQMM
jgi:tetratricopeptide (TPR) repeat protein